MKKVIQKFIGTIQKILITIFLIIIYIIGIGITAIFVMIFNRKILGKEYKGRNTFWSEAKEYTADINISMKQS